MGEIDLNKYDTLSELDDFVNQLKKTTKIFSKKEVEINLKKSKGLFAKKNSWFILRTRLDWGNDNILNLLDNIYDWEFGVGDEYELLLFSRKKMILVCPDLPYYSEELGRKVNEQYLSLKYNLYVDGWDPRQYIEITQQKTNKGFLIKNHTKSGNDFHIRNTNIHTTLFNLNNYREDKFKEQENLIKLKEEQRLKELQISQTNVLSELDKDGNGEVDVVEGNDFNTLLKKHQKSIVEVDRTYVQQFVKVSSYLKTKKGNIQSIFNSIKDTPNQEVLNEYIEILKDDIHTYNLVLFNSLNMIVSLVEDDMITFYEIHEMFDNLNMFDSKHEKDVSQKLTNIGDGLKDLMYEIRDVGDKISDSIQELIYVTEESNRLLSSQLSEIDSTMKVGNLINTINTYQNYKTNRRLNS